MCQNNGIIISLIIFKIFVIIIIPIYLVVFRKEKNEAYKKTEKVEISLLIILIITSIIFNQCTINSSIFNLKLMKYSKKEELNQLYDSNDANVVEKIESKDIYRNVSNKKVYYFNNDNLPLSDKKIECGNKDIYMKNYGNNITAVSILLSSVMEKNIDPIEVLNFSLKNNLFDCSEGVDTDKLLNAIAYDNNLTVVYLDINEVPNYLKSGGILLTKVINNKNNINVSCDMSNIILYNINNQNKINILNPIDKDYDYICPAGTAGYGQIIKANTNDRIWTLDEIDSIGYEYISLERR